MQVDGPDSVALTPCCDSSEPTVVETDADALRRASPRAHLVAQPALEQQQPAGAHRQRHPRPVGGPRAAQLRRGCPVALEPRLLELQPPPRAAPPRSTCR